MKYVLSLELPTNIGELKDKIRIAIQTRDEYILHKIF